MRITIMRAGGRASEWKLWTRDILWFPWKERAFHDKQAQEWLLEIIPVGSEAEVVLNCQLPGPGAIKAGDQWANM